MHSSKSAMGAYYRRLKARIGAAKATTATARKILIQYYRLVVNGIQYVDPGEEQYNERFRNQRIRSLTKQAGKLGMKLIDAAEPTPSQGFS